MNEKWQKWARAYSRRKIREKWVIAGAAVVVAAWLTFFFGLQPVMKREALTQDSLAHEQDDLSKLQQSYADQEKVFRGDPTAAEAARIAQLQKDLVDVENVLDSVDETQIPPEQMSHMVEDVLRRYGEVKLVSMQTLPVLEIRAHGKKGGAADKGGEASAPAVTLAPGMQIHPLASGASAVAALPSKRAAVIYRHGLRVTMEGKYLDLLSYVKAMEGLKWRMYWGNARLEAKEEPMSVLTIDMYTISRNEEWMRL